MIINIVILDWVAQSSNKANLLLKLMLRSHVRNAFSNTFRIKRFSFKRFRKRLRSHGISETFSKCFENVLRSHGFNANNVFYIWKLISIFFYLRGAFITQLY